MARNTAVGPWSTSEENEVLVIEISDMLDKKLNTTYRDGSYRVRLKVKVEGKRTKTFYGESAWCAAARYAEDVTNDHRRSQGDYRLWFSAR